MKKIIKYYYNLCLFIKNEIKKRQKIKHCEIKSFEHLIRVISFLNKEYRYFNYHLLNEALIQYKLFRILYGDYYVKYDKWRFERFEDYDLKENQVKKESYHGLLNYIKNKNVYFYRFKQNIKNFLNKQLLKLLMITNVYSIYMFIETEDEVYFEY